jgi:hypothetical protein
LEHSEKLCGRPLGGGDVDRAVAVNGEVDLIAGGNAESRPDLFRQGELTLAGECGFGYGELLT